MMVPRPPLPYDTLREMQTDKDLMEMAKRAKKPRLEWFFETPYSAYCGKCGRMIVTGGVKPINLLTCPWCDTPIDWTGWGRKDEADG